MLKCSINNLYHNFSKKQKQKISLYLKTLDYISRSNYYSEFNLIFNDTNIYKIEEATKVLYCGATTLKSHIKMFNKLIEYIDIKHSNKKASKN